MGVGVGEIRYDEAEVGEARVILHFLHRHVGLIALFLGGIAAKLLVPVDWPWWMKFGAGLVFLVPAFLLLFKCRVSRVGRKRP